MSARIKYRGGVKQQDRMVADKLESLKKALIYSYQAATAVLHDGREFRCLINPNKVTLDLDDKILSIPFEDICLNKERVGTTTEGQEPIGVKVGDVIEWKETGTHWIVYYQYLQEIAYFRGMMRQCESEALDINGESYYYYLKGPDEQGIAWSKSKHFMYNELNYTVEMYISRTTATTEFFHRFKKIKLKGKPFEVQAVDDITSDNVLAVYLKEDFTNNWADQPVEDSLPDSEASEEPLGAVIQGDRQVYPYDIKTYTIDSTMGIWYISNNKAKIIEESDSSITLEITTGRSGSVTLTYVVGGNIFAQADIEILSL